MNWKQAVSVSLAGAISGGLVALSHVLPASIAPIAAPLVSAATAAVAHWLDVWGSK